MPERVTARRNSRNYGGFCKSAVKGFSAVLRMDLKLYDDQCFAEQSYLYFYLFFLIFYLETVILEKREK